eukprot:TRINITY_DN4217_c0_g7_i1.p1 TRINITY_DN4217_c0_g7~~TRINITY_DN4217_c0_g7_i1.p1  ORF type:complete len:363 (-),score=68.98 TRINITY_DN4217_c0_g7_i1:367-1392(-)
MAEEHKKKSHSVVLLTDFLNASISGMTGVVVGQPLDTVKIRMQLDPQQYPTAMQCISITLKREKIQGLYKGLLSPMMSVPLINATVFMSYEQSKRHLMKDRSNVTPTGKLKLLKEYQVGCFAGLFCGAVTSPFELIKIRQQQRSAASLVSPVIIAKQIIKNEGFSALGRGIFATILRDSPTYGIYFTVYESICRYFTVHQKPTCPHSFSSSSGPPSGSTSPPPSSPQPEAEMEEETIDFFPGPHISHSCACSPSSLTILLAGGAAGTACWMFAYPFDVVKSRVQMSSEGFGIFDFWKQANNILHTSGWRTFWKGFGPCVVRAFPVNAGIFYTYEFLKTLTN